MSFEQDRADLQHHADEIERHESQIERHESFTHARFGLDEPELIGSVYIDPTDESGADADVSWWVRHGYGGSPVEAALDGFVPTWVADVWPLRGVRVVRDVAHVTPLVPRGTVSPSSCWATVDAA